MIRKSMFAQMILALAAGSCTLLAQTTPPDPFIGTWVFKIAESSTGLAEFLAVQSYHLGGTISENSSLLPTLTEGPAQGVWARSGSQYKTVFQLFVFDENREYAGMVRVRGTLTVATEDKITGRFAVDFIAPDGSVEQDIDVSDAVGVRLKLDSMAAALPVDGLLSLKKKSACWSRHIPRHRKEESR
jgi:hypothetical protein